MTSGDEFGLGNTHVTDNQSRVDFILLQFDQTVQLTSAIFNAFAFNGKTDSDATIGWGTLAGAWNQGLTFNNTNGMALSGLLTGHADALGTSMSGSRSLNLGTASGNFWLIGANFVNVDKKIDGFKLGGVTLKTVAPVPEPSTWAMMLAGFALVGVAMRRAIRTSEQRFTDKVRRIATSG
ncbi:PEPxxWA-CTERM sorting domain-containing protein [uncultured Sphingomonas sp.]|uniref:PEPxxWA-CTERM sorting domain-containing protein n=1 Tax=uncultured Sphingomonas sp. TaxID=158754 RepID=UPI0035CB6718